MWQIGPLFAATTKNLQNVFQGVKMHYLLCLLSPLPFITFGFFSNRMAACHYQHGFTGVAIVRSFHRQ